MRVRVTGVDRAVGLLVQRGVVCVDAVETDERWEEQWRREWRWLVG